MLLLVVGLLIFLGVHLVPTASDLRIGLVARAGPGAYRAAFSLISLAGFVLIVVGFHKLQLHAGKNPQIWSPPAGLRHATLALMLPAMILLASAYIPSRIRTAVRHPMLYAILLWALAHLLVRGDLGSMVLFGSFLGYAIYDRVSVTGRDSPGPLGHKTGGLQGDILAVTVGLALYAFMITIGHEWLIGVAPIPSLSAPAMHAP